MWFSRQEYWSGLLCPPPGHLPDPGIEPRSPALQADLLLSEPQHGLPRWLIGQSICLRGRRRRRTQVQPPGWKERLERSVVAHCSVLAWRIPWQRSLAACSPSGHRELDTTEVTEHALGLCTTDTKRTHMHARTHTLKNFSILSFIFIFGYARSLLLCSDFL